MPKHRNKLLGLSGRPNIGSDGLLFILPAGKHRFWMKDMQFNLDMVWIDQNQVVGISKMPKPLSADTPDPEVPRVSLADLPRWCWK